MCSSFSWLQLLPDLKVSLRAAVKQHVLKASVFVYAQVTLIPRFLLLSVRAVTAGPEGARAAGARRSVQGPVTAAPRGQSITNTQVTLPRWGAVSKTPPQPSGETTGGRIFVSHVGSYSSSNMIHFLIYTVQKVSSASCEVDIFNTITVVRQTGLTLQQSHSFSCLTTHSVILYSAISQTDRTRHQSRNVWFCTSRVTFSSSDLHQRRKFSVCCVTEQK